jgi:hypothetical protein
MKTEKVEGQMVEDADSDNVHGRPEKRKGKIGNVPEYPIGSLIWLAVPTVETGKNRVFDVTIPLFTCIDQKEA